MKLIIFAFIISISIHLLLFNNYKNEKIKEENYTNVEKSAKKSDIKYVTIKKQEPKKEIKKPVKEIEKKIEKPKQINKPKPTPTPKKYVKAKENIKFQEKRKQKEIQKAKEFQKKVLKEQIVEKKPSIQEKTLEDFLSQKEPVDKKILNKLERLYGREYENFTKVQKAYLEKNINNFQTITQRVLNRLGYPRIAAKLRLSGTNIVEFLFHPNGSISNLKIIDSSGYEVFDEYTLELIEIAYKDYPKPKTTTKLRFNVSYRLY
ncbi:hypothetical protein GCM10012288_12190 [Malaciobacter pacificus]|uniref:TonB domain-containing protein n=1 Tax=Malaciobacter pacificus TaxID=1080223 RepID=A0A5C2H5F0_9BACT|nr:energy transducer TonB [Malaciobacter pacificus]QEP34211.1 TonB domain-containing protein [Malaciobacter pacificus]GGD39724.1 hypothetical protein GCM10012288_12190 [Malaciobacter pacificus]